MQKVSELYKDIIRGHFWCEVQVLIDGIYYGAESIVSLQTSQHLFQNKPQIGAAVCAELDLEMIKPEVQFSRMAEIKVYVRVTDGQRRSEWLPKGVFYIDTRKESTGNGVKTLTIHGYDAMLKTVVDCRQAGSASWEGLSDIEAVQRVCEIVGLKLDSRVQLTKGLKIRDVGTGDEAYSCRELLGMIGSWYGGSWVISCEGKLQLVQLNSLPEDEQVLVTELGENIEVGGNEIHAE